MSKKGKVCRECGKPLTGIKSKFCTETCYKYNKYMYAKSVAHLRRKNFPERDCNICGKLFKPVRRDHRNCSKSCSALDAKILQRTKRKNKKRLPIVKPYENYLIQIKNLDGRIETHTEPTFVKSQDPKPSELNVAVLDFLAKGGEIKKLPDEIGGKTPSVNFSFGFDFDSQYGFGNELNPTRLIDEYDYNPFGPLI